MSTQFLARAARSVNTPNHSTSLLTIGEVATRWHVHPQSIRRWADGGELPCVVLPSGHRRFRVSDCLAYFEGDFLAEEIRGEDENVQGGHSGVCVYARVSSQSQDKAGSLDRQLARLLSEVEKREGLSKERIAVFKDVASSFGDRPGLNKLVDALLRGEVRTIYVEHANRLSRVPALTRLVEHLATSRGVQIIRLDLEDEDEDSLQADTRELVDFVQVIANRQAARKSRLVTVKGIPAEAVQRAIQLREGGMPILAIARVLKEEGYRTSKGDSISYQLLLRKVFDGNGRESLLTSATTGQKRDAAVSAFKDWATSHIIPVEDGNARLPVKEVVKAYREFCKGKGLTAENGVRLGIALRGIKRVKSNGQRVLVGVRLV